MSVYGFQKLVVRLSVRSFVRLLLGSFKMINLSIPSASGRWSGRGGAAHLQGAYLRDLLLLWIFARRAVQLDLIIYIIFRLRLRVRSEIKAFCSCIF